VIVGSIYPIPKLSLMIVPIAEALGGSYVITFATGVIGEMWISTTSIYRADNS
jgi:hypothetical protein